MHSTRLNISRLGYLLRSDLYNNWKRHLLIFGGLFVFCFLFYYVLVLNSSRYEFEPGYLLDRWIFYTKLHFNFFPIILLISGFIFTSISFWELRHKTSRQFYLALPATQGEKALSKWLVSAIIFPIIWLLAYQIFAQFTYYNFSGLGHSMVRLPIFDPWVWLWIGVYVLVQSVFFLGAVTMPRFSFIKTIILIGVALGLAFLLTEFSFYTILPLLSEKMINFSAAAESKGFILKQYLMIESNFQSHLIIQYPKWFVAIFGLMVLPITLIVSYLKLKEKEV